MYVHILLTFSKIDELIYFVFLNISVVSLSSIEPLCVSGCENLTILSQYLQKTNLKSCPEKIV